MEALWIPTETRGRMSRKRCESRLSTFWRSSRTRERSKSFPPEDSDDQNRGDVAPRRLDWEYATDFVYNVVGILGERGTGKTTLLHGVVNALAHEDKDMVLAPIQPERFGHNDTFLGWVLAGFEEFVQRVERETGPYGGIGSAVSSENGRDSLIEEFDRLQRLVAATHGIHGTYGEALVESRPDRYEYGAEMARLNSDGFLLRREMHSFLNRILTEVVRFNRSGAVSSEPPLIIIPVDDADMEMNRVIPILQQLRLLVSHTRVVALVAGSLQTFYKAIRIETLKMTKGVTDLGLLDAPAERYRACYELGRKPHRNANSTVGLVPSRSPFPAFLSRF
jgi:hypothetical protein